MYSLLNAEWMKNGYEAIASIVQWFTRATDSMAGMNLVIPALAAGLVSLMTAIKKAGGAVSFFKKAWSGLTASSFNVYIAIFTVIATVLTAIGAAAERAAQNYEKAMNDIADSSEKLSSLQSSQKKLLGSFDELSKKAKRTESENEEYLKTLGELMSISPEIALILDSFTQGFTSQERAIQKVNAELQKYLDLEKEKRRRAGIAA